MKNKLAWLGACVFFGGLSVEAQEKTPLKITDAIHLAVTQSKEAKATDTHVSSREIEIGVAKNKMLPDVKIGGQFAFLSTPNVDLKIPMGNAGASGAPDIKANQLYFGAANVNMPLYAGGKIRTGIKISEIALEAEKYAALNAKDQLAYQTIFLYVSLSKAQQTAFLMHENVKKASQQVVNFRAMEHNGIIARNDLLKVELQLSNYKVALQEAEKNVSVLNYQLVTLLQLGENTQISDIIFNEEPLDDLKLNSEHVIEDRSDMKMVEKKHDIALKQVSLSKSDYLPTLSFMGGYNALGIQNVFTVNNAMVLGLGVSYDLGSIYKNKNHVNLAKQKVLETEEQIAILADRINVEVYQADKNYQLAKEQQVVYQEALVQADENARIVKDKFTNGVADTDDLLEADVQKVQSQINLAIANANIIEKYYDLLLVNGQLTSTY